MKKHNYKRKNINNVEVLKNISYNRPMSINIEMKIFILQAVNLCSWKLSQARKRFPLFSHCMVDLVTQKMSGSRSTVWRMQKQFCCIIFWSVFLGESIWIEESVGFCVSSHCHVYPRPLAWSKQSWWWGGRVFVSKSEVRGLKSPTTHRNFCYNNLIKQVA